MSEEKRRISRREIMMSAGTGVAAAGLAVGPFAMSGAQAGTAPAWDHVADIICVGSGCAAMTAAAIAQGNGDKVLVLEKEARLGGTTAKSGAVHWIPNNPALRATGVKDERIDALRYMVRFSFPNNFVADHPTLGVSQEQFDLIAAFYDNGSAMVERLQAIGVYKTTTWTFASFGESTNPDAAPVSTSTPDYASHVSEDKVKTGRAIAMIVGDGKTSGTLGGGVDFIDAFSAYLNSKKTPILTRHRVTDLVRNAKGDVVGVVCDNGGKTVRVRARKAVIFGTGGFAQNPVMMRRFLKTVPFGSCCGQGSEGDLIAIASRAGAALGNMPNAWWANVPVEQALKNRVFGSVMFVPTGDSMMYVNKHGKRFVDEYRSYTSRGKSFQIWDSTEEEYPNHVSFMVFDQRTIDLYGGNNPLPTPGETPYWLIKGGTLAELGKNIAARIETLRSSLVGVKLSPDFATNLAATVKDFNRFAQSGVDEQFGRGGYELDREFFASMSLPRNQDVVKGRQFRKNRTMYPFSETGPYYAIIVGLGLLDTNGGPVVNAKAQIVDYEGKPIPGLYGAGNCIAAPSGEAYWGPGGTVGPGMTYGFIAANNANKEPVKEPA